MAAPCGWDAWGGWVEKAPPGRWRVLDSYLIYSLGKPARPLFLSPGSCAMVTEIQQQKEWFQAESASREQIEGVTTFSK